MSNYMDIKDIAKEVRKNLKVEFPDHKFSVTIDRFSMGQALDVAVMAAPADVFRGKDAGTEYAQMNRYHINQDYYDGTWSSNGCALTDEAAMMLLKVDEIANARNWDKSEPMIDYFNCNYYMHLAVGKWDRPFQVTG